ncbi:MAG TPA: serine hydrolase domain-containing protein [Ohtaekwangia sp.]|uniref:serine hydrolase domain-containing protein n=1 Tax=Ohtaekwangia sp. TaxID=2066019 RepID=UPI002F93ED16
MRNIYITFFCFILFACAPKKDAMESLDTYLSSVFPANEPGAAILIMKRDSIIFAKGYGLADMVTKEPITPKTLFNLGSISKTFVASAALLLQEQGKLSVEDSLLQYFPEFKNKEIASKVKIKHLLTHTSGLPDNRNVARDTVFYLTAKDSANWYPETRVDSLLFEPGSHYEYSNPAFNGLALIVEKVSGMPWQRYIKQNIFIPAGMISSTITDGAYPSSGVSHGYVKHHGQWVEDDYGEEPTFPAAGNGGVWSSVEELALYEQACRKHIFLKEETIRDARTVKRFANWSGSESPFIGWSWFVTKENNLQIVGHPGSQGGFLANYVVVPEKEIFFVILCNTPREEYEMKNITRYFLNYIEQHHWYE